MKNLKLLVSFQKDLSDRHRAIVSKVRYAPDNGYSRPFSGMRRNYEKYIYAHMYIQMCLFLYVYIILFVIFILSFKYYDMYIIFKFIPT